MSKPARNDEAAVAAASAVLDELLELLLEGIDIVELDEDTEPAGCDEVVDELPLDEHDVVASASATTALAIVMVELRIDMESPAYPIAGMYLIVRVETRIGSVTHDIFMRFPLCDRSIGLRCAIERGTEATVNGEQVISC